MIGGRPHNSKSLHFAQRRERRFPTRLVVGALVIVVLLMVAGLVKAAVASVPNLTVKRVLAASVVLPGAQPAPAWPTGGEAAVEVQGLPSLGSSGPTSPVPIASLAKIMTAYVILQDHPIASGQPGFTVTITPAEVSDYDQRVAQAQSVVAVSTGESINELQLLQGLLVASGNNVAAILANYDAGSVSAFISKMNSAAGRLGMSHTTYTDPSGLAGSTVSTASDQLLLASQAMKDPVFASIVGLTSVTLPVAGQLPNFNRAVGTDGFVGIKTGSDSAAGGCLVFAVRQTVDGHPITILGAVLGQDVGQQLTQVLITAAVTAATNLVHSVTSAVAMRTVLPAGTLVATVTNAAGRHVSVATTSTLQQLGYGGETVPLSASLTSLQKKLAAGQVVATVELPSGTSTTATASATMPAVTYSWKLRHDL